MTRRDLKHERRPYTHLSRLLTAFCEQRLEGGYGSVGGATAMPHKGVTFTLRPPLSAPSEGGVLVAVVSADAR